MFDEIIFIVKPVYFLSLLFFLLFFGKYLKSQENHYDVIRQQYCECLNKLDINHTTAGELRKCLVQTFQNNAQLIYDELSSKYPDSIAYQKSYEYGQSLGRRLDTDLVYSCNAYYKISDSLRLSMYKNVNKDSILISYKNLISSDFKDSIQYLEERAKMNYLLGKYGEANKDAEEILKVRPQNMVSLIIKGNYLETQKRYKEAASIYYDLDKITGQHNYLVWAAINNRKQIESTK